MKAPIAQAAALVCHANAAIRGVTSGDFLSSNSTCRSCERVDFAEIIGAPGEDPTARPVAPDPDSWFESLKSHSVIRVWLARRPSQDRSGDHMRAGFVGGGGTWLLLTEHADGTCAEWLAQWVVGNREAPDRRIWRVTYGNRGPTESPRPSADDDALSASRGQLESSLEAISQFSGAHTDGDFDERFQKALQTLRSGVAHGYHADLAPEGTLAPPAAHLLDACQSAWVFGGMGSWNDQGFSGPIEREFRRVSAELYESVCAAIAAATNSSARAS